MYALQVAITEFKCFLASVARNPVSYRASPFLVAPNPDTGTAALRMLNSGAKVSLNQLIRLGAISDNHLRLNVQIVSQNLATLEPVAITLT